MRDGKVLQRGAMWVLATGVAGIAAVVSYSQSLPETVSRW